MHYPTGAHAASPSSIKQQRVTSSCRPRSVEAPKMSLVDGFQQNMNGGVR